MHIETAAGQSGIRRDFSGLGTMNHIQIFNCFKNQLLDKAVRRVSEIDGKMSAFDPGSEIFRLNQAAGRKPVAVSEEAFLLLKRAKEFAELSGGAFDMTIRPLVALWGIGRKSDFIPQQSEIKNARKLVNHNDLILDESKCTAYLKKAGQAVDLGGIAKGYAADEVKRLLTEGGVPSALIDLGGNIVAVGSRPDGEPWQVGIQNPASVRGEYIGTLAVTDKTVVTSGSNEQFFVKAGSRYHHILDPRTGRPAQSGLLSVTVVGISSVAADALTTAAFVLGTEKGAKFLKARGVEAVFTTEDYRIYLTEGLIGQFTVNTGRRSGGAN